MNLGNAIKSRRVSKGINQLELANRCNITQSYLSQIENNLKEPNLSTLKKIAEVLEVPLPLLFFLSLDENDVAEEKRRDFIIINNSIKSLVSSYFLV